MMPSSSSSPPPPLPAAAASKRQPPPPGAFAQRGPVKSIDARNKTLASPRASVCSARWYRTISRKRRLPFISLGMPRPGLVWTLFLTSLLGAACARSIPEAPEEEGASPEEAFRFYDALQQQEREQKNSAYMRDLAILMERLKQAEAGLLAQSQQQTQSQSQEEELPVPLPITQSRPFPDGRDPSFDKRSNYIGLCHFKICNMGRKRNTSWNPWNRN